MTAAGWEDKVIPDSFRMNDNKIKFVIVGSGNISNTYIAAIEKIADAELVGIVSRGLTKPKVLMNTDNIVVSDSLENLPVDYDAVILCTPNAFHHTGAVQAAKLGKHVLTEKPLDISIPAMNEMIAECKKMNVKLAVAYQRRFSPGNLLIKRLIEEGRLGNIFAVDLSVKNYRDDNYYNSSPYRGTMSVDGGGPFIQQASHYIDLYCWLFGRPSKISSKLGRFLHDIEAEDHGAAICLHDNGMIGTIIASTAAKPGFPARLEIFSDKGCVIMENDLIIRWEIEGLENPMKSDNNNSHTGAATHTVDDTRNHEAVIADFVQAIKTNNDPFITGDSAKIATEVILQIYESQFDS